MSLAGLTNRYIWAILIASSLIMLLETTAIRGSDHMAFSGQVWILNSSVPDGLRVYARAGIHYSNIVVVENSQYSDLVLDPPAILPRGTKIDFFIGGPLTSPTSAAGPPGISSQCDPIISRNGTSGIKIIEAVDYRAGQSLVFNLVLDDRYGDTDDDEIPDIVELSGQRGYITEPSLSDTDDDGVLDGAELVHKGTNPTVQDTDCDGRIDGVDSWPTVRNQVIYTSAASAGGTLAILVLSYSYWRWGLSLPWRKRAIARKRGRDAEIDALSERLRVITVENESYDRYIKLHEVIKELNVNQRTAILCLKKLKARRRDDFYIIPEGD